MSPHTSLIILQLHLDTVNTYTTQNNERSTSEMLYIFNANTNEDITYFGTMTSEPRKERLTEISHTAEMSTNSQVRNWHYNVFGSVTQRTRNKMFSRHSHPAHRTKKKHS